MRRMRDEMRGKERRKGCQEGRLGKTKRKGRDEVNRGQDGWENKKGQERR